MDPTEKTTIEQRLVETGEKERLKEHLRNRLMECGWREEIKIQAKQVNIEYLSLSRSSRIFQSKNNYPLSFRVNLSQIDYRPSLYLKSIRFI